MINFRDMKKTILSAFVSMLSLLPVFAQQFISSAKVEYEVKTSIKKTMSNDMWGEMLKENLPQFKTGYYNLLFSGNKSIFRFDHWDEKEKMPEFIRKSDEENIWYCDYSSGKYTTQKDIFGSKFYIEDSLKNIEWRFSNENRIIAGFNCRKAIGKIMDSVYVFAFYTEEITLTGGPCSVNGLPGLILGLTIPRMYTSYIATKVSLDGVKPETITPPKAKKYFTTASYNAELKNRMKEWIREDDTEDDKTWINQFVWRAFL
jgi:GLPGLI family protein